jgi:hypothetical protein
MQALHAVAEKDVDPAYISAFSALMGAAIGGLASFSTSWLTQRTQLTHAHREAERARVEALYGEFINEATRLLGDALSHQKDELNDMVKLYGLIGRMRLVSSMPVVIAAERVAQTVAETYLGPNRDLRELLDLVRSGGMNVVVEFSEACRSDLAAR